MSRASTILFALGFFIAIISAAGMYVVLTNVQAKPATVESSKIVIAFQNIPARTEISAAQVGQADWPKTIPTPAGGFEYPEDVVGKLSLNPVYQGQPIIDKDVIDKSKVKDTHSNAAFVLDKGTVAMAFPVSIRTNVAQAVQAGDRVDIFASFPVRSTTATGSQTLTTQRLFADVLVLQVGPWPAPGETPSTTPNSTIFTFQLKEQEAMVLEHAVQNASSVMLVLRPATDHDLLPLDPVTVDYIIQNYKYVK